MRKYAIHAEEEVRTADLVREWAKSGLLEKEQAGRILASMPADFRRTNVFLRLLLFGFGILIIAALAMLIVEIFHFRGDGTLAVLCFFAALFGVLAAEVLIGSFRLYRFGVEEAAAIASVGFTGIGGVLAMNSLAAGNAEFPGFVGLVMASATAMAIFARFGYVYAGILSMLCLSMTPFHTSTSAVWQRLLAAGILCAFFLMTRRIRRQHDDDFQGSDFGTLQALAWLGIYAYLNLKLTADFFPGAWVPPAFHAFTYVLIWILPVVGGTMGIREKDRRMLDINIVVMLATLATNKPYLGLPRQTWDPVLLGLLLIGTAIGLRRWLASADRHGFTPVRILDSDRRRLSIVGTASVAVHSLPIAPPDSPPPQQFEGGGGRSGGGGADGTF